MNTDKRRNIFRVRLRLAVPNSHGVNDLLWKNWINYITNNGGLRIVFDVCYNRRNLEDRLNGWRFF